MSKVVDPMGSTPSCLAPQPHWSDPPPLLICTNW
jgi:hypothetical protein